MKAEELRNQSDEELTVFLRERKDELLKLRFQHHTGQLENVARLGTLRRQIARAECIRTERTRGIR